ncbi:MULTISPECIES: putative phage tail protein [unclassified Methylobacterium]|uniref:YmfQ family protein n=1 Tax=unclassified Methylobacterium TaxID=2615210 RepID=UPI002269C8E5|nr:MULTISPECIES: putative phage tail protein [unclassified Methylobacterium]
MSDAFIRRDGGDYAQAFANLLPTGAAWSRDPASTLMQLIRGQAEIWGAVVDPRAADLLEIETDPRFTLELLGEWERAYGLPDPCVPVVQTLPERRQALAQKIAMQGGQSRAFFIGVAAALGYAITITEYVPFQFGLSSFGGSHGRFNPPGFRYCWTVRVGNRRLTRFQFGASSFGRDPLLDTRRAEDIECIFGRIKPAHTLLFFNYGAPQVSQIYKRFSFGGSEFGRDPLLKISSS